MHIFGFSKQICLMLNKSLNWEFNYFQEKGHINLNQLQESLLSFSSKESKLCTTSSLKLS